MPPDVGFATKPHLAAQMIGRAITAGVPFAWMAGDSAHRVGELEMTPRPAGKGHLPGVSATHSFSSWDKQTRGGWRRRSIAQDLDDAASPSAWRNNASILPTTSPGQQGNWLTKPPHNVLR